VKDVNHAVLTVSELLALLHQDISRKCLGSFMSPICGACAVLSDVYILKCFFGHPLEACAVKDVNGAELTVFELIALLFQNISRKCLGISSVVLQCLWCCN